MNVSIPLVEQSVETGPATVPVRFYTVPQVAAMMQLSKHRVYEIIRQRLLPAVHIGRQIRIAEPVLVQWSGSQN